MKILFINSIGRDKFGGGEKWMVGAAKGLLDRGHDLSLIHISEPTRPY